ncbi:hypothetical protein AYO21_08394 [Fonsecaea monophora]|uniref:Alpha/beta hydrolase fold-3 domain-containing protein n=1 Tax=Fonsecaea monophora TaxID=254056 RepID=A0A177EZL5_9EURO|nr:hypothetical protein AYO21_08394 [Fonsecaea monophora]OAG37428.1 hypothetical protein AYO21_08394 [Fonsecaea monophora]
MSLGINPQRVAIAGVSTGGNLTLASMFVARESGDPLPACAVPISPWIDLEHESESMMTMDELEPMCHRAVLDKCADLYLPLGDKTSPLLSALDGDLTGLPPLFGPIGVYETLLDDARALALKAKEANVPVELKIYDRQFHVFQIFSQGFGYGYIIGFGALFAIGMSSAVVSSWTTAATMLTSATEAICLACPVLFWGGAGASVQILLFSVAAIELKRKAPNTHTLLEFVRTRYGAAAHCVLGFYSLFFMGINLLGGLKATFLTDWMHTVVIYMIMLMSLFVVYSTSKVVGSPSVMFDLLTEAAQLHPVAGNQDRSYLTMRSVQGGFLGLIFAGAGFGGCVDPQLAQEAIAANPASTLMGYLFGGTAWFSIPFCLATTYGPLAAATGHLPAFPTYPNRMNAFEVASGIAMPYGAMAVMGNGGAAAILTMIFMAVTSSFPSETMAVTAFMTYDVYQACINPNATGKQLVRNLALVAGNMMSLPGPIMLVPLFTFIKPDNYDWELLKKIKLAEDALDGTAGLESPPQFHVEAEETMRSLSEVQREDENAMLLRARRNVIWASVGLTLAYVLLSPIPTRYVFSKHFFIGWIVVAFLWAFYASTVITLLPIWEGRRSIVAFRRFLITPKAKRLEATAEIVEKSHVSESKSAAGQVTMVATHPEKGASAQDSETLEH